MKKITRLFFLICTLCSVTAFAQDSKNLSPQAAIQNSTTLFGLELGAPINIPRCNPYKPPIDTSQTCYSITGDTALFYNQHTQNIRIYFPRDLQPKEMSQQWLKGSLYNGNLVLLQIATPGISKQALIMDALKKIFGHPSLEKTITSESMTTEESQYLPGSLLAAWNNPTIEVLFVGEFKSNLGGIIRINLTMKAFDALSK